MVCSSSVEEQFESLAGNVLFTTLDLAQGYLQIPLDEESQKKTAFITPTETGQFTRLMFDLTDGPFIFSRLMQIVLGELRGKVAVSYLDDILIFAKD